MEEQIKDIIRDMKKDTFLRIHTQVYICVERIWGRKSGRSQTMRHELTYKRMTPPSTQNLKALDWRWRHSLIWVDSYLILVRSPRCLLPRILTTSGIRVVGLLLGQIQFDPVSKVFLMEISGKCVSYKCERRYKWRGHE